MVMGRNAALICTFLLMMFGAATSFTIVGYILLGAILLAVFAGIVRAIFNEGSSSAEGPQGQED
jgi:hypothetical protein